MIDYHAGRIQAREKIIADRDAEIQILQCKAQGIRQSAAKLAAPEQDLQAELADRKAKLVATVNDLRVEFTGQMAKFQKGMKGMQIELDVLRMEHDKCPAVIAELRAQIRGTKDALEMGRA
jgi:chromosome segregation ATPase